MKLEQKRGFTLIELLVVIAIIGLLASIVLASLNSARKKSRDARRIADLKQLQNALELYANDNSGNYPSDATTQAAGGEAANAATANGLSAKLTPTYIASIPGDPLAGSNTYFYKTTGGTGAADATGYCVSAYIEGTAPTPSSTCQTLTKTINGVKTDGVAGNILSYEVGN